MVTVVDVYSGERQRVTLDVGLTVTLLAVANTGHVIGLTTSGQIEWLVGPHEGPPIVLNPPANDPAVTADGSVILWRELADHLQTWRHGAGTPRALGSSPSAMIDARSAVAADGLNKKHTASTRGTGAQDPPICRWSLDRGQRPVSLRTRSHARGRGST
jgi:hypothetical protein